MDKLVTSSLSNREGELDGNSGLKLLTGFVSKPFAVFLSDIKHAKI